MAKKTLDDHMEDVRRERDARIEREIGEEAAARVRADEEADRKAAVAAEVGLPPDTSPAEVTRLHKLRESQFWDDFIGGLPHVGDRKFRALAAELGFDPDRAERHDVWNEMRRRGRPETRRPIVRPVAA
jgi:hypothetical protein